MIFGLLLFSQRRGFAVEEGESYVYVHNVDLDTNDREGGLFVCAKALGMGLGGGGGLML